jgi:triosephosphate isomerase
MRRKLVAGNWKMNKTLAEASATMETILREAEGDVDVVVCPPFTALDCVHRTMAQSRSKVMLGAQDVFWKETGAFTGSVSAAMLADLGCRYCIVGHSETRGRFGKLDIPESTLPYFAETDETVNLKLRALIYHNVRPILCVGETITERRAGKTDEIIQQQLLKGLEAVDASEYAEGVVAYEPVWAIGTGEVCDAPEAERVCAMIRKTLVEIFDDETAEGIRVLYGGSVKASNAKELLRNENVDGGLVGGASLDAREFVAIVHSAA